MRFVDEVEITVQAGRGGNGMVSFRREKFVPLGGPDGGDGGRGGNVFLQIASGLNTLVDFRHTRRFAAQDGRKGGTSQCTGRGGEDLFIKVPAGTLVRDADTGELIGDLAANAPPLLVAAGGAGGFGNLHFKTSTNRAPGRALPGRPGETRRLQLELRVLADVGLLGQPNAGKSTLLRAVSQARPKVADYPFTTLHPELGVVRVGAERSFVMADIPGLIEGAAQGAGLGIQFLRHLARTRLLLHIVDLGTPEEVDTAARDARTVVGELKAFSAELARRERWLVLNKMDLLTPPEAERRRAALVKRLRWRGPVFAVSAATGAGCPELMQAVMIRLEEMNKAKSSPP